MRPRRAALLLALPVLLALLVVLLIQVLGAAPPAVVTAATAVDEGPPPAALPIRIAPQDPSAQPDSRPGTFEGRVLSSATVAPIAGADLTFSRGGAADSVRSDPEGAFLFRPPTAGRWLLAAVAAQGYFPFAPEWGFSPVQLEAAPGRHVRGIEVFLTPAAEITGLVVDEDGEPVPGADVQILGAGARAALIPIPSRFVTGADGTFRAAAPQGSILEASKPGYYPGHAQVDLMAMVEGRVRIIVAIGPAGARSPRAPLAGRAVTHDGRPIAGALVEAAKTHGWAYSGAPVAHLLTDADGRFRFSELDRSPHQITVRAEGHVNGLVSRVLPGGADVTITLPPGGKLRGCVRDAQSGAPVAPFTVLVYFSRGSFRGSPDLVASVANPSGCYLLEEVEPGPNAVVIQAPHRAASPLQAIDVPPPPGEAQLDVALASGGTLTGVVRDEDTREPLAGAWVKAEATVDEHGAPVTTLGETTARADGTFSLSGLPGLVRLIVNAEGHHQRSSGVVQVGSTERVVLDLRAQRPDDPGPVDPVGIGAVLVASADSVVVGALRPGHGADAGNLVPGDELLEIDGHAVADLGLGGAVEAMRGAEGTSVFLQVRRGNRTLDVEVPRQRRR
jgi:hypothetical protein